MSAGHDFAHTDAAEDARVVKARTLAGWCWDAGVVSGELGGWDEVTRRRVARLAGVNPPSSWDTWARVVQFLEMKEGWAAAHEGDERAKRLGERPEWLPHVAGPDAVCESQVNEASEDTAGTTETPLPKNISSADADTETTGPRSAAPEALEGVVIDHPTGMDLAEAMERHPAGASRAPIGPDGAVLPPRGWPELIASGRMLGNGRVCGIDRCGKPAIAATMTVYRCSEHPPRPGEWGAGLNWTPKDLPCAANRCYCGSCPTHRLVPASTIVEMVPRDAQADRSAARGGAQRARQAARTARSGR